MEHAKRMVLIDERLVDRLYGKHESTWRKPTEQNAKSKLVREMKGHLDEQEISDDIKVKNYNQDLLRFLNIKRKLPDNNEKVNLFTVKETVEPAKPRTKVRKAAEPLYKSRPKRIKKAPKKLDWTEW
jgi:ATP-dependent protease HslVU (ClpYQ) ATPase subunit